MADNENNWIKTSTPWFESNNEEHGRTIANIDGIKEKEERKTTTDTEMSTSIFNDPTNVLNAEIVEIKDDKDFNKNISPKKEAESNTPWQKITNSGLTYTNVEGEEKSATNNKSGISPSTFNDSTNELNSSTVALKNGHIKNISPKEEINSDKYSGPKWENGIITTQVDDQDNQKGSNLLKGFGNSLASFGEQFASLAGQNGAEARTYGRERKLPKFDGKETEGAKTLGDELEVYKSNVYKLSNLDTKTGLYLNAYNFLGSVLGTMTGTLGRSAAENLGFSAADSIIGDIGTEASGKWQGAIGTLGPMLLKILKKVNGQGKSELPTLPDLVTYLTANPLTFEGLRPSLTIGERGKGWDWGKFALGEDKKIILPEEVKENDTSYYYNDTFGWQVNAEKAESNMQKKPKETNAYANMGKALIDLDAYANIGGNKSIKKYFDNLTYDSRATRVVNGKVTDLRNKEVKELVTKSNPAVTGNAVLGEAPQIKRYKAIQTDEKTRKIVKETNDIIKDAKKLEITPDIDNGLITGASNNIEDNGLWERAKFWNNYINRDGVIGGDYLLPEGKFTDRVDRRYLKEDGTYDNKQQRLDPFKDGPVIITEKDNEGISYSRENKIEKNIKKLYKYDTGYNTGYEVETYVEKNGKIDNSGLKAYYVQDNQILEGIVVSQEVKLEMDPVTDNNKAKRYYTNNEINGVNEINKIKSATDYPSGLAISNGHIVYLTDEEEKKVKDKEKHEGDKAYQRRKDEGDKAYQRRKDEFQPLTKKGKDFIREEQTQKSPIFSYFRNNESEKPEITTYKIPEFYKRQEQTGPLELGAEYGSFLRGRIGLPYRERTIYENRFENTTNIGGLYIEPFYNNENGIDNFFIPFQFSPTINEGALQAKYETSITLTKVLSLRHYINTDSDNVTIEAKYLVTHDDDRFNSNLAAADLSDNDYGADWLKTWTTTKIKETERLYRSLVYPYIYDNTFIRPPLIRIKAITSNELDYAETVKQGTHIAGDLFRYPPGGKGNGRLKVTKEFDDYDQCKRYVATSVTISPFPEENPYNYTNSDEEGGKWIRLGFKVNLTLAETTKNFLDMLPNYKEYMNAGDDKSEFVGEGANNFGKPSNSEDFIEAEWEESAEEQQEEEPPQEIGNSNTSSSSGGKKDEGEAQQSDPVIVESSETPPPIGSEDQSTVEYSPTKQLIDAINASTSSGDFNDTLGATYAAMIKFKNGSPEIVDGKYIIEFKTIQSSSVTKIENKNYYKSDWEKDQSTAVEIELIKPATINKLNAEEKRQFRERVKKDFEHYSNVEVREE